MNDVARLRNGLQIRRLKLKVTSWMKHASRLACPDLTVVRTTDYSSCVLWATPLMLTPTRYSPANTPTVPTTTMTSSWHRLLPARRPQRTRLVTAHCAELYSAWWCAFSHKIAVVNWSVNSDQLALDICDWNWNCNVNYSVSQKTSPTFLAITVEFIVGLS